MIAESVRDGADSGSVSFTFNKVLALGSSTDYKVVKSVSSDDEVKIYATTVKGTNGTLYESLNANVKVNVSISATGKITIKMPQAELAQVVTGTPVIQVSADINEQ